MELALFKTVVSLGAVLGLMVVVLFGLKKLLRVGAQDTLGLVDIEIVGRKVIQPKRAVYIVKVLNKLIILGATEHGFQSLGEIAEASVMNELELKQEALEQDRSSGSTGFKRRLRNAESFGDFFQKPFNVVLWGGAKPGVASGIESNQETPH